MAYVITQPCIGTKDASCVEVCPVDCIHSTDDAEQYFIDPDECIDCGVCAEVCPVEAIFFEDDVPEQWQSFMAQLKARGLHEIDGDLVLDRSHRKADGKGVRSRSNRGNLGIGRL